MQSKLVTTAAAIVALLLTIGAGVSIAKDGFGMHGHGMRPEPGLMGCINKLNLSTETKNAINNLIQSEREANKASWQNNQATMKTLWATYYKVLTASPLDENALTSAQNAIIAQMENQMQAGMQSHFDLDRSIVKLLTPEELAALATCLESKTQQASTTSAVVAGQ